MAAMQAKQKTVYIFRHGETDWNRNRRLQGAVDIPLNENGRTQAAALREFFSQNPVHAFLSSDLSRAAETAKIAAGVLEVPIFLEPRLREMNLGQAEGLMIHEVEERFGKEVWNTWAALGTDPQPCFPDGESKAEHLQRLVSGLKDFIHAPENSHFERIGVATHGGSLRRLIHHLLPELTSPVVITNCIVYEMTADLTSGEWLMNSVPKCQPK